MGAANCTISQNPTPILLALHYHVNASNSQEYLKAYYTSVAPAAGMAVQVADVKQRVKQLLDTSQQPTDRMYRARTVGVHL